MRAPSDPEAAAAPPRLALRGLVKSFGSKRVLDGVDLEVGAGRSLVIIGGSGQGKSVTIKIAAGLLEPDAGEALFEGRTVSGRRGGDAADLSRRMGFLFQGGALFDSLPVWRNVAFRLLVVERARPAEARRRALEALDEVGLGARAADLYPSDLSGGMLKRAALARAVVGRPELLFFDEPTTGLDPVTADRINELIRAQVTRLGSTAVTITHDLASARKIGDQVAMLHEGRIIWRGTPADLDAPGDPRVEQFVQGRAEGPLTAGSE